MTKRILAFLLAAVMAFGLVIPAGAVSDTTVETSAVNEGQLLSDPFYTLEQDGNTISFESVDLVSDENDSKIKLDDLADIYDISGPDAADFSSKRLLVESTEVYRLVESDAVLGRIDNLYLLQFESERDAKLAYAYFNDSEHDGVADIDATVVTARMVEGEDLRSDVQENVALEEVLTNSAIQPLRIDINDSPLNVLDGILNDMPKAIIDETVLIPVGSKRESSAFTDGDMVVDENQDAEIMVERGQISVLPEKSAENGPVIALIDTGVLQCHRS